MAKRKLTETCHYDDDLIGNKHDEGFPSKSKKSCNMPDPLLAQNLKGSGTADVRILSLSEHDGVIERCDSIKSDSSEEDFFFRDKAKKKDKRKNLFDPHENAEDSSKMLSENDRKGGFDQDEKIIDTSIYFRRNLYRKVGETENRDQGQESRGFDEERRSERGRPSWRNNDSGRGRPSWRSNDSERGRPSWRNNDSGRGRPSWRNDNSRNKGNFERRGGKWKFSQDNPNEIPVDFNWEDKRRRVTDAKDWSNNVNKQKDKGTGFESNEGTKTAANKGQREEGLHPSWQAKRRERQQEVSINQFKGQRIVFE
nr:serum response factor-binding protein 1-like [Penaeus vannamei]